MIEAFITLGMLRSFPAGKHLDKLICDPDGVDHLVLGCAGMYVASLYSHLGRCRVEVFVFKFSDCSSVDSIGEIAPESFHVEFMRAFADLFVGIEGYADFAVFYFWRRLKSRYGCQNLGDACLVVSSKQGGAVSDDKI